MDGMGWMGCTKVPLHSPPPPPTLYPRTPPPVRPHKCGRYMNHWLYEFEST
ncbi:hypothetical protein L211DRAFT_620540 [Terfezia boudieri ATCC MYA-4762]|uniref:Uncharacterized protein n=1 Tax=Terfezia boudieri ATCC MYA-4762 TaxID=1051890 RepID=A0A3N4LDL2_9PEZI|nr:hypothetical protein L211DRAFT_620540 [Terfezia boudieri ATCC MYA-4762]